MSANLDDLLEYLDGLQGRPLLSALAEFMQQLDLGREDVAQWVRFSEQGYQRNLIRAGNWYHLWIMCWRNGQRSPIHDHTGSACAIRVIEGTATITDFERAPNGHIKAVGSKDIARGGLVVTSDDDLHQVSNLQAGRADLITLHVYTPPLLRMGTYSILDRTRGEDVWAESRKFVTDFPENSETPLDTLHGWVTPNRLFFVRNHFPLPPIERASWRLSVGGLVDRSLQLSWDDLLTMPQRSVFATVECAGNGRSFLHERHPGVQWGAGAIGHAEWTGVPLLDVLEKAGVRPGALEVLFEGADQGTESDHPDPMHFARSLPMGKALDRDTLLVTRMNGELLTPAHGAPLRLFVPGWYGVASVKWLSRIEVIDKPFLGYFQSKKYTIQRRVEGKLATVILGTMAVKAEIVRPQEDDVLGVGTNRVFGIAWAGEEALAHVELSVDEGKTWSEANLLSPPAKYCWSLWEYLWEVAQPGEYELLVRATSATGRVQPMEHEPLNGGYMIHHTRPRRVRIASGQRATATQADLPSLLYDMNAYAEENMRLPLDAEMEFSGGGGI